MKNTNPLFILIPIILLLASYTNAQENTVKVVLNSDGTIKKGINGSFSTEGYQISYGKNGEPILNKNNNPDQINSFAWSALGSGSNGTNGTVYAVVTSGSDVYIGGQFNTAGGIEANNIAKWNGTNWSALGTGLNSTVYAINIASNGMYVGGSFTTAGELSANRIAKWDGSTWSALGAGVNNNIYTIVSSGYDIYVGGSFGSAGGNSASRVAKWDGSSWSALGTGVNGTVYALAISGTELFVGGNFSSAGGSERYNIAKFDGSVWSSVGNGTITSSVRALCLLGNYLYVGGEMVIAVTSEWCLGRVDLTTNQWVAIGSQINIGYVYTLVTLGSNLYIGGSFTTTTGVNTANRIAMWDGSNWSTFGDGLNGTVRSLAISPTGIIYVGGNFSVAGSVCANCFAKYEGSTWSYLGNGATGTNGWVNAIAVVGNDTYIGGYFSSVAGINARNIAKWNGTSWSTLGVSPNDGVGEGSVGAIAVYGSEIFVGGAFLTAGSTSVNRIAKWDGSSWSALGSGLDSYVRALAVSGDNLYAGGDFSNYLRKYDIASGTWSIVPGVDSRVRAITVSGGDIYVGGNFFDSDESLFFIKKWNGTSWSALGTGVDDYVYAIAAEGSNVIVGGKFTSAGGSSANRIARWDGSSWSALGTGVNNLVYSLKIVNGEVYAGGDFTTAGGNPAYYIAKYNINTGTWSSLDNGTNGTVSALEVNAMEECMYAGGSFGVAGGISAYSIVNFTDSSNPLPMELTLFQVRFDGKSTVLNWQTASEVNNYGFEIERSQKIGDKSQNNWEMIAFVKGCGNSNSTKEYWFTDNKANTGKYSYRLKQIDNNGLYSYSNVVEVTCSLQPSAYELYQNYPNPFNPSTTISYQLPVNNYVTLRIYDVVGREVITLVNEEKPAGRYDVVFDGSNLSSGIYLYQLKVGQFIQTKKFILLK